MLAKESNFGPTQTEELLAAARAGDAVAIEELLDLHRIRLKRMIGVRMDDRLLRRIDPSDVVQEAIITAASRLDRYLRQRPIAFYPWLRQIAWERLIDLQRQHLGAERRSLSRETISDRSSCDLANLLSASADSPLARLAQQELQAKTRAGLEQLSAKDREVLVLRLLEQTSVKETAEIMQCSEGAVETRQVRALQKLREFLCDADGRLDR